MVPWFALGDSKRHSRTKESPMHNNEHNDFFTMRTIQFEYCHKCGAFVEIDRHTPKRCERVRKIIEDFMPIPERTAIPKDFYDAFGEEVPHE
jgi:hypothetical protein